jgi:hypothetical protein
MGEKDTILKGLLMQMGLHRTTTEPSTTGHAFIMDGRAISWSSRKQELVTLSTAEAEYVVATHAAKECICHRP